MSPSTASIDRSFDRRPGRSFDGPLDQTHGRPLGRSFHLVLHRQFGRPLDRSALDRSFDRRCAIFGQVDAGLPGRAALRADGARADISTTEYFDRQIFFFARSMRAFRVVRLFGRMGSLRDIVSSLTIAILPVCNALLIILVVSAICEGGPADGCSQRLKTDRIISVRLRHV